MKTRLLFLKAGKRGDTHPPLRAVHWSSISEHRSALKLTLPSSSAHTFGKFAKNTWLLDLRYTLRKYSSKFALLIFVTRSLSAFLRIRD